MMKVLDISMKAKQLLEEGVMQDVFDLLREDLKTELVMTKPEEGQKRETLYMILQGLDKLELKFAWACSQQDFENFQKSNLEANERRY